MLNVSLYFLDIFTDVVLLVTFLVHGWFWSSVGSITFIALPYLVAMYGIVRTRKQALKDYIDWDDIDWDYGYGKKYFCLFFAFSNFAIGVRRVFDAVPRFHGTMYRGQPVELHDTVRGNANVERDRPGEHPAALPATVHGGVLPYERMQFSGGRGW